LRISGDGGEPADAVRLNQQDPGWIRRSYKFVANCGETISAYCGPKKPIFGPKTVKRRASKGAKPPEIGRLSHLRNATLYTMLIKIFIENVYKMT
jgi:hypothetical protein